MSQIIVGMDESEGAAGALQWATREGQIRGWPVTALLAWSFLDPYQLKAAKGFDPDLHEETARRMLATAVVDAVGRDAAAGMEQRIVCDLPENALVDASAKADLLVVGARGLGGFKNLLLGSVSNHCAQRASCPVVVVGAATTNEPHAPERIVVGVDGSDTARDALRWALDAARPRHATVEVVHAWRPPAVAGSFIATAFDPTIIQDAAQGALDAVVDAEDTHDLSVTRTLICGGAAPAILDAAHAADLVVVGSRGPGSVKSLRLGSVSQQVTHHAPCPVVVVPPHD